jgi:gliding motility-associated-like protein
LNDTLNDINPQGLGRNNSPVITSWLVPFACACSKWEYNLGAYDPDGDSLAYELVTSKGFQGKTATGYQFPHENTSPGCSETPYDTMRLDPETGQLVWEDPQPHSNTDAAEYNVGILVKEYRDGFKIGTQLVDLQIIVKEQCEPPEVKEMRDTCIVAGDSLSIDVWGKDPDKTEVELSAQGAPFQLNHKPAQFTPTLTNSDSVSSRFTWYTDCEHIQKQYYQVTFRAIDEDTLQDQETWRIKVVGPSPDSLTAEAQGNDIELNWKDPYTCEGASHFKGFSIWRRKGPNAFQPDTCNPGLAGKGYTRIAQNVTDYSYIDQNLSRGVQYCYRIQAEFYTGTSDFPRNKAVSLPSNEACASLERDLPIIYQADVWRTDPDQGKIEVAWLPPDPKDLDTNKNPGPYKYKLYRSPGQQGGDFQLIHQVQSNTFYGLKNERSDTVYIDKGINTVDTPYTYQLAFIVDGDDSLGASTMASSIYLNIDVGDKHLTLNWDENVPWDNHLYFIWRSKDDTFSPGIINNTVQQSFVDDGLENGRRYCYFVQSIGDYSAIPWLFNFANKSQWKCATPIDTVPPCPPELSVSSLCDSGAVEEINFNDFKNHLDWNNPNLHCTDDVAKYHVYYKPTNQDEEEFQQVATLSGAENTRFTHDLNETVAGCYAVTAIDSYDNESNYSNTICKDNCPYYKLPNAFTPNGDGENELFTPFLPYRFVEKVDMKIYNRWGKLVYQTENPDINWDGTDIKTGKDLSAGVYHYVCEVYEKRVTGIEQRQKPLKGYIQLIR